MTPAPRQLTFELADSPPATFDSFVAGNNVEVVATLIRFAMHETRETSVVVWGAEGSGKTHLLLATIAAASGAGRFARRLDQHEIDVDAPEDRLIALDAPEAALIAIDDVDSLDGVAQGRLFTLYNRLAGIGGQLVVMASVPPARMSLRDDIRTRLASGLVFELQPLRDADKPSALCAYARARGFSLSQEVIDYLLAHGRRDMTSLVRMLIALDRHSLALARPITVPMVRDWLLQDPFTPRS
ncbi:MAG TPA: DnaA regulatory inactivator Hda [Casimicrobiaceae bacterium]|nr:DnaA regulatory inactivator Hda [Casimicrobiaceae bacterium]